MKKNVLITGGAGFIGSHLVESLIKTGYYVRVLDNLEPQVHGSLSAEHFWPAYSSRDAEYILGDVRDIDVFRQAIDDIDIIYHFAALTGIGQSMYQIKKYLDVNIQGTANLLEILHKHPNHVEKVLLASSRAIYGEGLYYCKQCGQVSPDVRTIEALEAKIWEVVCPNCSSPLQPIPTPESKYPAPGSIYAISKLTQEQILLCFSQAYQIPAIILRFFNVYGPRQSLLNPYTGIIATFMQRIFNNRSPEVYEDGLMTRDFVFISDAIKACLLALDYSKTNVFNIGSGEFNTIYNIAKMLCQMINPEIGPEVVGIARVGDIRHCSSDTTRALNLLGYQNSVSLTEGLQKVIQSLEQERIDDQTQSAKDELRQAGLLK